MAACVSNDVNRALPNFSPFLWGSKLAGWYHSQSAPEGSYLSSLAAAPYSIKKQLAGRASSQLGIA
jgi:hypothetical protein